MPFTDIYANKHIECWRNTRLPVIFWWLCYVCVCVELWVYICIYKIRSVCVLFKWRDVACSLAAATAGDDIIFFPPQTKSNCAFRKAKPSEAHGKSEAMRARCENTHISIEHRRTTRLPSLIIWWFLYWPCVGRIECVMVVVVGMYLIGSLVHICVLGCFVAIFVSCLSLWLLLLSVSLTE